jgi:hypothetical protein
MAQANTLAYYDTATIKAVKSFINDDFNDQNNVKLVCLSKLNVFSNNIMSPVFTLGV